MDVKEDVTGDAFVEWFTGNDWEETQYGRESLALKAGRQEIVLFDSLGVDLDSEEYKEYYQRAMEEISKAEKDGRMDELSEEERAEYRKIADEYIYVNVP